MKRSTGGMAFVVVAALVLGAWPCMGQGKLPLMEAPKPLEEENPTNPLVAMDVPEVGKSFRDARFGTTLMRVTEIDGTHGRHEYSRFDPFNKDQSMIVLTFDGDWKVYRTAKMPYNQEGNLFRALTDLEDPRWDREDACLIWGLREFSIVRIDAKIGETKTIKDFKDDPKIGPILKAEPDLYRITMKNEGEPSQDMRYWALCLQGREANDRLRYVFTWDRQEDRVLGVHKLSSDDWRIDWVGMSPLGTWALIAADSDNRGKLPGLIMADKELKTFQRLNYDTAHSDVGLDSEGKEVIVMQNTRTDFIDMIPLDPKTKPILDGGEGYEGTNRVKLIRLFYNNDSPHGFNGGVHISCNCPGYAVVSTSTEPDMKEQNWLDRTIVLVKLDPKAPRVFYLAKVYNTSDEYWEETHAAITNDGSKVVWASNWGKDVGDQRVFLMQLDMPTGWKGTLDALK